MEEYYACIIDFCPVSGEDLKNKSNNLHKAVFNTVKVVEPPIYEPEHSFYFLQERQCLLCVSFYILINFISSPHIFFIDFISSIQNTGKNVINTHFDTTPIIF